MAMHRLDVTRWFNNEDFYPDLLISLDNCEIVKVHKAIVFEANKSFEEACRHMRKDIQGNRILGVPGTPAAVEIVLRTFYGIPIPSAKDLSWDSWIDLIVAAERFFEPAIGEQATHNFLTLAWRETDVDEIFKMLHCLGSTRNDTLHRLVRTVREHHCAKLMHDDRYGLSFDQVTNVLWQRL